MGATATGEAGPADESGGPLSHLAGAAWWVSERLDHLRRAQDDLGGEPRAPEARMDAKFATLGRGTTARRRSDAALRERLGRSRARAPGAEEGDAARPVAPIQPLFAPWPLVREAAAHAIGVVAMARQGAWPGDPGASSRAVDGLLGTMRTAHEGGARAAPGCRRG